MILEKLWPILISTLGIAFFCIGEAGSQPLIPLDPETDSTRDGLYYVDPRVMDTTWVRPDLNLAKYTGIMIMPSITSFREVFGSYHPRTASDTNGFRVSEINKNRLRDYFGEAFHEFASQLKPYEIADGVGRNVLLVQGFLIDVVRSMV